ASSIPNLVPSRVTVIDQKGDLLSARAQQSNISLSQEQFEYTQKVEDVYTQRIENILAPILGINGLRAQVSAEMDFTVTEKTQESYNPDLPALRSEQVFEELSNGAAGGGVPGALSNQPPGETNIPEVANGQQTEGSSQPSRRSKRSTVNYELDRTISHTRLATGLVKRLSVAVVVDDRMTVNEEGETVSEARTAEDIERITSLVKDAVGYNAQRGDTINIINASFSAPEAIEPLPELPIWQQTWFWDLGKKLGILALILFLFFGILRPIFRQLATVKPQPLLLPGSGDQMVSAEGQLALPEGGTAEQWTSPEKAYQQKLDAAQQMVQNDSRIVAQVVKNWVGND
ncbi:MAG: flagellar M-ring protein FliF, partial [Gammaproteobacteria bacterium]|nr:flagellar M-ring protein FliF [Gammaproteobacteria bacterium]